MIPLAVVRLSEGGAHVSKVEHSLFGGGIHEKPKNVCAEKPEEDC